MSRNAGKRAQKENIAAYAASQPLFDALRSGANKVAAQQRQLSAARDIVQNVHVNLPGMSPPDDLQLHERYVMDVLKAWQSATETYTHIFEELANVTAADVSLGRPEAGGHGQIEDIARTARDANRIAKLAMIANLSAQRDPLHFKFMSNAPEQGTIADDEEEERSANSSGDDYDGDCLDKTSDHFFGSSPTRNDSQGIGTRGGQHSNGHVPLKDINSASPGGFKSAEANHSQANAEKNSTKTVEREEAITMSVAKTLKRAQLDEHDSHVRNCKKRRVSSSMSDPKINSDTVDAPPQMRDLGAHPHQKLSTCIQYEDVSEIVAARLKAREEARRQTESKMKRKRQSVDSFADCQRFSEAQEPSNKKIRSHEDDAVEHPPKSHMSKKRELDSERQDSQRKKKMRMTTRGEMDDER